jgi:hypothetical protein
MMARMLSVMNYLHDVVLKKTMHYIYEQCLLFFYLQSWQRQHLAMMMTTTAMVLMGD